MRMVTVNGVRYRPEDAPERTAPEVQTKARKPRRTKKVDAPDPVETVKDDEGGDS